MGLGNIGNSSKIRSTIGLKKWKLCKNCHENVNFQYSRCPYCNSDSLEIKETNDKLPSFSRLRYINKDSVNWWMICPVCGKKVNKAVVHCPFCGNADFKTYSSSPQKVHRSNLSDDFKICKNCGRKFSKNRLKCPECGEYTSFSSNEDNFFDKVKYSLFYWNDEQSDSYIISKTKVISLSIYVLSVIYLSGISGSFFAGIFTALFPFLISYVIGSMIHGSGSAEKEKPVIKSVERVKVEKISKPVFTSYDDEVNALKLQFEDKVENARRLIEKCFPSPQLTNDKFTYILDQSLLLFNKRVDIIHDITNSTSEFSDEIDSELKSNIGILTEIIEKVDNMTNELLINLSESDNDDVSIFMDEIESLTDSIKNYK